MTQTTAPIAASAAPHAHASPSKRFLLFLSVGALGVVYGDIGTSPLYAVRECFVGEHAAAASTESVLGVLSLLFWSLTVIVSVKYLTFLLRADNRGEGGILALLSLLIPTETGPAASRRKKLVTMLALFGAALLLADGMITPSISVLSAVEGLHVATLRPIHEGVVLTITVLILVALFIVQRFGTGRIAFVFGPIMLFWFAALFALGLPQIIRNPQVLHAVNPLKAFIFFVDQPHRAFVLLGYLVLCFTGAEALYADMGHFGRGPIRLAWYAVVFPALLVNYFGQGAYILSHGPLKKGDHVFYMLAPQWSLYPLIALATIAAVIASQALISGAFSLCQQAMQLGYTPRLHIVHTSSRMFGQIYIPEVSKLLMVACVFLVLFFKSSSNLAAAYGIAVMSTMLITTMLFIILAHFRWHWPWWKVGLMAFAFLLIDVPFLASNLIKFKDGGWFPIVVGIGLFVGMTTWRRGRLLVSPPEPADSQSLRFFLQDAKRMNVHRVKGTSVFLASQPRTAPTVLLHHFKHNQVLHEQVILLHIRTENLPHLSDEERVTVTDLGQGFFQVIASYGFMEDPSVPNILQRCRTLGMNIDPMMTSYYLGRATLLPTGRGKMVRWRKILFAFLYHNERPATAFYDLPPNRVVEIGRQVEM